MKHRINISQTSTPILLFSEDGSYQIEKIRKIFNLRGKGERAELVEKSLFYITDLEIEELFKQQMQYGITL